MILCAGIAEVTLRVEDWPGHLPGQHVNVRLDSGEGRRFSIANPSMVGENDIQLAVKSELLQALSIGQQVAVRGPLGDGLVWNADPLNLRPLLLIAGGMGIVPMMAIARTWRRRPSRPRMRVIYSVRSADDIVYSDELRALDTLSDAGVEIIYTRSPAEDGGKRIVGRLSALDLEVYGIPATDHPECYVCGPESFVEDVARMLVQTKHLATSIHTEWDVALKGAS